MIDITEYIRFWPYGIALAVGIAFALIDRRVIGHYLLGVLLVLVALGGQLGMYLSPFTFGGGDYYMESLIVSLFALAGMAGYALAVAATCACTWTNGGGQP